MSAIAFDSTLFSPLSTLLRAQLAEVNLQRAQQEYNAARGFDAIPDILTSLGANKKILRLAAQAQQEEYRHAALFHALAEAYHGASLPAPVDKNVALPAFPHIAEPLRQVLWVLGMCAVNETFACAFLQVSAEKATFLPVSQVFREALGDEIGHAQIGWAFLASWPSTKNFADDISRWMVRLVEAQWNGWLRQIGKLPEPAIPEHAIPEKAEARQAMLDAIGQIIIPGLAHVGINPAPCQTWLQGKLQ